MKNGSRDGQRMLETLTTTPLGPTGRGWQSDSLGPAKLAVLCLEQVELLGEEHRHHEEQEQHEGGRANGHTHHLEVGDDGLAAHALVPDVVLCVAPAAVTG